jgi:ubiquinone/menaquinone biosynthesis C-methylase UbiE/DNA-binding transcriptional ArsR family regulator
METVKYFKALSDETRLRLLNLLVHHELSVNEITDALNMGQSRISRHLKILTDCNLLVYRRDGLWAFYSASKEGPGREFIISISGFLENDYDLKIDLSRMEWIIEDKRKEKKKFFDSIANRWDRMKKEIMGDLDITPEILSRIEKRESAADLGCGTGELLLELSRKANKVIGIDHSPKMLEEVKTRSSEKGNNLDLRIGTIEQLPVKDEETDLAVLNMVLHHLDSPFNGIAEANRILKYNSPLIIVDLEKHSNEDMRSLYGHRWLGFSKPEIENWLKNAGFTIKETEEYRVNLNMKVCLYYAVKEKNISNLNQINIKEIYNEHADEERSY